MEIVVKVKNSTSDEKKKQDEFKTGIRTVA